MERYTSPSRFAVEKKIVFRLSPLVVGRASDVAREGDFFTHDAAGLPILVTRDPWGTLHAMLNMCLHRGVRLVDQPTGNAERLVCPYHAWSYDLCGRLTTSKLPRCDADVGATAEPTAEPAAFEQGLNALPRYGVEERHGFVWVKASPRAALDVAAALGPSLDAALASLDLAAADAIPLAPIGVAANWKLLADALLDASPALPGFLHHAPPSSFFLASPNAPRHALHLTLLPTSLASTNVTRTHLITNPGTENPRDSELETNPGDAIALVEGAVREAEARQASLLADHEPRSVSERVRRFHDALDQLIAGHPPRA